MIKKKEYITPEVERVSIETTETWPNGGEGSVPPLECFTVAPTAS